LLSTIRALELPDWLTMSGAVYQRVLNALTKRAPDYGVRDYDLGYFDASDISDEAEDAVIRRVAAAFDEWLRSAVEVRNQARVHVWFEGATFADQATRDVQLKDVATTKRPAKTQRQTIIEGEYARGDAHVDTGECAAQTRSRLQSCSGFRRSAPI
jgi:hypothetical protein